MRLSEAEWQLMNALWQDHPATAREIAKRLPAQVDWAHTTIKTMHGLVLSRTLGACARASSDDGSRAVEIL